MDKQKCGGKINTSVCLSKSEIDVDTLFAVTTSVIRQEIFELQYVYGFWTSQISSLDSCPNSLGEIGS